VAKVIPLHKKGATTEISNYRPISNLCTLSKVFEKLILGRLWDIADKEKVDLTGATQHGFKPNRSTTTAALTIQSVISRAIDNDNFAAIASLDLSAAFDVVDRGLLFERLHTMGIPEDVRALLKEWLKDRMSYVEVRGSSSYMRKSDSGTVQGSVLGPILFSLFIRPIYDLEEITTYADDNYVIKEDSNLEITLNKLKESVTIVARWLKSSGLKVNDSKTEVCVFHRKEKIIIDIVLDGHLIKSTETIKILGMTFDCNLNWDIQINNSVKNANKSLFALRVIKNYFTPNEMKDLLTSLYFSLLFYGSEVWHLPDLNFLQKKK
jgi:hypothetical protein